MTATTTTRRTTPFDDRHSRTTLWHVIRSEWTKFWSVRSTIWTLLVLVVATIGFSVLISWASSTQYKQLNAGQRATNDVVYTAMSGVALGQLAIAVLGALIITSEYSTGGIKATFTAVPQRLRVLTAKGLILALVGLVAGEIIGFVVFFASMPFWSKYQLDKSLSDPGVLRAVIGAGLYIMASGLFGFAIGTLLRHTAGAITVAVALLFVIAPLLHLLPGTWGHDIYKFFTSTAGSRIMSVVPDPTVVSPWIGYLTFTIWWAVPLLIGAWLMKRRDA